MGKREPVEAEEKGIGSDLPEMWWSPRHCQLAKCLGNSSHSSDHSHRTITHKNNSLSK